MFSELFAKLPSVVRNIQRILSRRSCYTGSVGLYSALFRGLLQPSFGVVHIILTEISEVSDGVNDALYNDDDSDHLVEVYVVVQGKIRGQLLRPQQCQAVSTKITLIKIKAVYC